jgi:hypothetical protein
MFMTVCVIAVLVRLASGRKAGVFLFVALGVGLMFATYGVRVVPQAVKTITISSDVQIAPPVPPRPPVTVKTARPKKPPTKKPPEAATPSPPPVVDEPGTPETPAIAESKTEEGPQDPITLYQGTSQVGRPVDTLPGWVTELADAKPGSGAIAFSSDRFASIEAAESELWNKAREFVAGDLRLRNPGAAHWTPSTEFLKQRGLIVERCVERTAIEVGQFVEPMYRVHWKLALSSDLRNSVADAWRPTVQAERLKGLTFGFLCATGGFAFLNIILRSVAARLAARKSPTTQQVA